MPPMLWRSGRRGPRSGPTAVTNVTARTSTYRADVPADQMLDVMQETEIRTAPVTRPDGTLIGLVLREDLERAASTPSGTSRQRAE